MIQCKDMDILSKIEHFVSNGSHWQYESGVLKATFHFPSFTDVQSFVNSLMLLAADMNHHPTVTFGYADVSIETTTHDAENSITEKDIALAEALSQLFDGA